MRLFEVVLHAINEASLTVEAHPSTLATCSLYLMLLKLGIKDLAPHHYFSNFRRVKLIFKEKFKARKGVLMGKKERRGLILFLENRK